MRSFLPEQALALARAATRPLLVLALRVLGDALRPGLRQAPLRSARNTPRAIQRRLRR
nr:hypothetical protein [Lysobacter enzymogenes]